MNLVCSSPKFESKDQSSYFNIMPGSYMATPASDKPCSPGYFDIKPRPSPAQTPYFDTAKPASPAQTPFFDCDTMQTPFFEQLQKQNGIRQTNIESSSKQQYQIQFTTFNLTNGTPNSVNNVTNNVALSFSPKIPNIQRRQSFKPTSLPPVNKNKPYSMPGLTPFTPATTSFEEFSSDVTANLIKQRLSNPSNSSQYSILLLDLRSFSMFTTNHIKSSLNICVPSTLLKRCSFTADKITETLVSDVDRDVFKEWPKYENIILYDSETDSLSESCPLFHLCKKFRSPICKAKIGYLKGGFAAFYNKYEDLCEKSVNIMPPSSATFPRKRSLLSRKPGPFTCPTPIIETAGVNPFFSNIRQNIELSSGITETIPIRLPEFGFDKSKIPAFMREVIGEGGKMKLAEAFHEIERIEQNRLQSLMLLNSNQATADSPFSISAGMEKGTKNRYNNIWPYDHTRVKISECRKGDCDYVNASYVQAEGCNKTYIATQGPLPATYEDFWKVIWEQNSRVIVMLTKEEEAGRIQCHRYWSDTSCRHGPIEVTFLSETSDGSADNTIITRKFRITHLNYPGTREITQLHFLGWPDFGIPDSPKYILNLIDVANLTQSQAAQSRSIGPMVVHCSAGCGRTGTFCTIDSTLSLLYSIREQGVDVNQDLIQKVVLRFREQRLSMVQTLRQYVFCYEAILSKLVVGSA